MKANSLMCVFRPRRHPNPVSFRHLIPEYGATLFGLELFSGPGRLISRAIRVSQVDRSRSVLNSVR